MSLWTGLDYALLRADMPPDELTPTSEIQLQWPKWGRFVESRGKLEKKHPPRTWLPKVRRLYELLLEWRQTTDEAKQNQIWREILGIHADRVYTIGVLGGVPQPVVVSNRVRNVPTQGIWAWDPGARFGKYQMDTFWVDNGAAGDRAEKQK